MYTLGVGTNYFVFAGKTSVYVEALPKLTLLNEGSSGDNSGNGTSVRLPNIKFTPDWIAKNGHIECIAISQDDRLVAVGDSMHGLYIYKLESVGEPKWLQIFCRTSNKRIVKLQFTSDRQHLTFLDKQGDIYAIQILDGQTKTSNIKKILGHTSFISDYVTRIESKQIISCDRDEKIRVSNFPDAFVIQGFKLGHTESVINIACLGVQVNNSSHSQQTLLLSISLTGTLLLWDFDKPVDGAETDFLKTWNIKELLPEGVKDSGVKLMKAVSVQEAIFICVTLVANSKVYILQASAKSLELDLVQELEMGSENVLAEWSSSENACSLIIYTPDLSSIRFWNSSDKVLCDLLELNESMISDLKALSESVKLPVVPMKKRLTTFEDSTAVLQDLQLKKVKT